MEDAERLAQVFRALGDPTRLRIFETLRACGTSVDVDPSGEVRPAEGATVGEVCCRITGTDRITSTLSHHLKELRLAGLVLTERRGQRIFCRVDENVARELADYLRGADAAGCCEPQTEGEPMQTVLFVCVHNAGRSQMAEAFVNHLARERGLRVWAESAGTVAGAQVNPAARAVMEEVGISLDGHHPKQITQEMVDGAARVVTMGCGVNAESCPARLHISEDWGLDDPAGEPIEVVRAIRDQIRVRVEQLLTELAS